MFPLQLCSLLQEELVAFVTMVLEVLVEELLWIYSKKFLVSLYCMKAQYGM